MFPPATSLALSNIAGIAVFAPSLNASIAMFNLVSCIASDNAAKQRRAGVDARARFSPLQTAILLATGVSLCADGVVFYACVRALIEGPDFLDFAKMMFVFNVLKRVHSIVAVHITFLRFQIVTGRFNPRPRGSKGYKAALQRVTENPLALVSTLVYALVGFGAVGFQLHAYLSGNWNGPASRGTTSFAIYRGLTLADTTYFALIGLVTDCLLIPMGSQIYDGNNNNDSSNHSSSFASAPPYAAHLNPTPVSPLARVKKYYNHWINLSYEVVLFLTFVACSIVYFWDPFFNVSVFVEQVLLAFVAWNGYVLLHAALKEDDAGPPAGAGGGSAGGSGSRPQLQTAADVWKVNPSGLGGDAQMELQQRSLNAPPGVKAGGGFPPQQQQSLGYGGGMAIASPGYAGGGVNLGGMGSPIGSPRTLVSSNNSPNIYNGSGGGGMGVASYGNMNHMAPAPQGNMYSRNF